MYKPETLPTGKKGMSKLNVRDEKLTPKHAREEADRAQKALQQEDAK